MYRSINSAPKAKSEEAPVDLGALSMMLDEIESNHHKKAGNTSTQVNTFELRTSVPITKEAQSAEKESAHELTQQVQASGERLQSLLTRIPDSDAAYKREMTVRAETAIKKSKGNLSRLVILGSVLVSLVAPAASYVNSALREHNASRYAIERVVDSHGKVRYSHEDPETTEILDHLSGKHEMSEEMRLEIIKEAVRVAASQWNLSIPDNLEGMNEVQTRDAVASLIQAKYPFPNLNVDAMVDQFIDSALPDKAESSELYERVWKIEEKVGSPRIRWTFDASAEAQAEVGSQRAFYDPNTNTIYINALNDGSLPGVYEELIGEQAHSLQYSSKPVTTRIRSMLDALNPKEAQYHIRGSIESEAHGPIASSLENELYGRGS